MSSNSFYRLTFLNVWLNYRHSTISDGLPFFNCPNIFVSFFERSDIRNDLHVGHQSLNWTKSHEANHGIESKSVQPTDVGNSCLAKRPWPGPNLFEPVILNTCWEWNTTDLSLSSSSTLNISCGSSSVACGTWEVVQLLDSESWLRRSSCC